MRLFSRYGVKRTSMNDIAAEAAIARQTLYNAFSNKDEVLRATIRLFSDRTVAEIERKLPEKGKLGEQLDLVFRHMTLEPYDRLNASPNAEDIVRGFDASSQEEIAAADERFRALIERLLAPFEASIETAGLTPKQLSRFVQVSASAAKHSARSRADLLKLLAALKIAVLKVADGS